MSWSWRILRGAVEQEILFPSEACYAAYIEKLTAADEPFEVVEKTANEDGTVVALMRKRYNQNLFLPSGEAKK